MASDQLIGTVGFANMSALALFAAYRCLRWFNQWDNPETWANSVFRKRLVFHLFLVLTPLMDLPEYYSMMLYGTNDITTYAFHKLESFFLFAALSITISDWSTVLKDIREYESSVYMLGQSSLLVINLVYFAMSFINFVICFTISNLDVYLQSYYYLTMIFFQISVSVLITVMMLHAGLTLYGRISGAVGINLAGATGVTLDQSSNKTAAVSTPFTIPVAFVKMMNNGWATIGEKWTQRRQREDAASDVDSEESIYRSHLALSISRGAPNTASDHSSSFDASDKSSNSVPTALAHAMRSPVTNPNADESKFDGTAEFRNALQNLNLVMLACTVCIVLQMVFLILNYGLGDANSASKTPGPALLYWAGYAWIPLWGPICALLYLSRAQSIRKRNKQHKFAVRLTHSIDHSSSATANSSSRRTFKSSHHRDNDVNDESVSSDSSNIMNNTINPILRKQREYFYSDDDSKSMSSDRNQFHSTTLSSGAPSTSRYLSQDVSSCVESDALNALRTESVAIGWGSRFDSRTSSASWRDTDCDSGIECGSLRSVRTITTDPKSVS